MPCSPDSRRGHPLLKRPTLTPLTDLLRPDGRPEVYDVPEVPNSEGYVCVKCQQEGHFTRRYHKPGEVFMSGPLQGGGCAFFCKEHLPDDVVIYNPLTDLCRDKTGQNEWRESDGPVTVQ